MRSVLLTIVLLLSFAGTFSGTSFSSEPEWKTYAQRFTGESAWVREQAIHALKRIPDLDQILRNELQGKHRFLALDVISTLELRTLLPDLIRESESDVSGYTYHAMNALIHSQNRNEIALLYKKRLLSSRCSPAAKLALIDTLGRLHVSLSESQLRTLLKDPTIEVVSATLYYLREWILRLEQHEYIPLLEIPFRENAAFQIKLQALSLVSELPRKLQAQARSIATRCLSESHIEVREACRRINESIKK